MTYKDFNMKTRLTLLLILVLTACSSEEDKMDARIKGEFISGCLQNMPKPICECAYDKVVDHYGLGKMRAVETIRQWPEDFNLIMPHIFQQCVTGQ